MRNLLENAGFKDIEIELSEVTDEYARKWGYGLGIKQYIGNADIIGYK
ncbi:MAG: methyltransferase [Tissierellia bacterium]|nr:methyltransferase [Tissierellia bacterium]